jgi:5,10-methylene-tetrahydrofolate dehydrogenase/methenyl tetrahydrofolate cyclohydrolase
VNNGFYNDLISRRVLAFTKITPVLHVVGYLIKAMLFKNTLTLAIATESHTLGAV